jgi:hypothetical protein
MDQFCAPSAKIPADHQSVQIGGSVRGYQGFLASSAISSAAGQTTGSTVYLCSAAVDANTRFCRGQGHLWLASASLTG